MILVKGKTNNNLPIPVIELCETASYICDVVVLHV